MPTDSTRLHAVFDLAMRIGEGLLTNGAAASEVTATVLRVTSSSGLRNVSVQVTFNEVTISYLADESATPFTRVRSAQACHRSTIPRSRSGSSTARSRI